MPARRTLVLLGVGALAVRLAYVLLADPVVQPISDGSTYRLLAVNLAEGRGYISPYRFAATGARTATAEFPPLHPGLLSVAALLGARSIQTMQLALAAVGSITPVLSALLAARLTGDRRLAVAAGVLIAVHPLVLGSDGALMSETPATLLVVLALLALDSAVRWRSGWWSLGAGGVIGLAVLTRGESLLLVPLVALPLLVRHPRRLALLGAGLLVVVAPWVARNHDAFDGRVVLSNNVGGLLNNANCPDAYDGPKLGSWVFHCYERVSLEGLNEAEQSAALRRRGVEYARDHLERAPAVVAARLGRTWGVYRPWEQVRLEVDEGRVFRAQAAGVVLDWLLVPLFAVGVWSWRRHPHLVATLVGPLAVVSAMTALSYGNVRFRQVAEPALVIGAVLGARVVLDAIGRRGAAPSATTGPTTPGGVPV